MITLYSKDGLTAKAEIHKFTYTGTFMGTCFLSATISSPCPINFADGDYCVYRGETFILSYDPAKEKQAKRNTHGEAFIYDNIKFNSLADELTRIEFNDIVLHDNGISYTSLPNFSFYAKSVKDLADRIQANLDREYKGSNAWTVTVSPDFDSPQKNISVNGLKVSEALQLANSEFGANYIIRGRTITIGTEGISVGKVFGYGKGNGLYDIQQVTNQDAAIITRLKAYGSNQNLPYRYYNKLKDSNGNPYISEALYIPHLMLPEFPKVENNPSKIYIDSDNITKYGVREGSVYFDSEDNEIYPSIEGMTAQQLAEDGISVSLPAGDNGILNELLDAENPKDDGKLPEKDKDPIKGQFTIYLKDLGFDLSEKGSDGKYKYASTETMQISMKSGACVGRIFDVVENGITKDKSLGYTRFKVVCNRFTDSSINIAFPNSSNEIKTGDKFVILGIEMPDVYIRSASMRLLEAAKEYLSQNDSTKYTYTPKIDEIFMANNPEIGYSIKEGDIFNFADTDLDIDASVIIQTLKITEGESLIPSYEVSLSNDRVTNSIEKMQNAINSLASNFTGVTIGQVKSLIQSVGSRYFLSRLVDDSASGNLNLTQNVSILKDLLVKKNIISEKSVVSNQFGNDSFTSGQFGSGFRAWIESNGQSYAEIDNLLVRREMLVNVLSIAEIKSVGGQILLSLANMYCKTVTDKGSTWKCAFDNDNGKIPNQFALNDQVICRKFTGENVKYYWALVTAVGDNYIELSKTDKDGLGIPSVEDEIIQFGNRTNPNRQSAIMLSAYGSDAPSIKQYAGVNSYDLTGKEVTVISPQGNKFTGSFTISTNGTSTPVYKDRGTFQNGKTYYLNDRVSYLGSYWVCIVNTTVTNPNEGSSTWRKDTTGQTDINNAVAGVMIGGRNLLNDSSFEKGQGNSAPVNQGVVTRTPGSYVGNYCMKTVIGNVTSASGYSYHSLPVTKDKVYTISFYLKAESSGVLDVKIVNANWASTPYRKTINVTTSWERFDLIFTATETNTNRFIVLGKNITFYVDCIQLEEGNKVTSWELSPEDVQTSIDNAYNEAKKVRTEYKSEVKVLDDKIASKVSQSVFDDLGNRVSQTESRIDQQAGQITSVVEKVNDIKIGGKNLVDNSQAIQEIGGNGADDHEDIRYTNLTVDLVEGEEYTFQCKTDGIWGYKNDTVEAFLMKDKIVSPGNFVSMGTNPCTFIAPKTGRYWIRIDSNKGSVKHSFWKFQIEKGNKATDWGLSQNDINKSIKNVENRVDTKNRTYYQDDKPEIPSEGHKVGDLWYMESLVDSSGNVNPDKDKNIYQLQHRWDGTTWDRINWSVSRSKITQTENSITSLVENTELLSSRINQTADQIQLAVSEIKIGGKNLVDNSQAIQEIGGNGADNHEDVRYTDLTVDLVEGKEYTFQCKTDGIWGYNNDTVEAFLMKDKIVSPNNYVPLITNPCTFVAPKTGRYWIRIDSNKGSVKHSFWKFQIEKGNKATDWGLSQNDINKAIINEVASLLTIKENKISLASKTIELNGSTIAKAIAAKDLEVESPEGLSTLKVKKDGTFYAKGTRKETEGIKSVLTIDSDRSVIEFRKQLASQTNDNEVLGLFVMGNGSITGYEGVNGSKVERIRFTTDRMPSIKNLYSIDVLLNEHNNEETLYLDSFNTSYILEKTYNIALNGGDSLVDSSYFVFRITSGRGNYKYFSRLSILIKKGNTIVTNGEIDSRKGYQYTITESGMYTITYTYKINGIFSREFDYITGTIRLYPVLIRRITPAMSMVACNGLASIWDASKYFYISSDDNEHFIRAQGRIKLTTANSKQSIILDDTGIKFEGLTNKAKPGYLYVDSNKNIKME